MRRSVAVGARCGPAAAATVAAVPWWMAATYVTTCSLRTLTKGIRPYALCHRAFPHAPSKLSTVPLQHVEAQPSSPPVGATSKGSSAWPWTTPVRKIIACIILNL